MLLVKSDYNRNGGTDRFSAFWFEVADVKSASRNKVLETALQGSRGAEGSPMLPNLLNT